MIRFFTASGVRIDDTELSSHVLEHAQVSFDDGPLQPMRTLTAVEVGMVAAWLKLVGLNAQREHEGAISLSKSLRGYPLGTTYADVVSGRARKIFERTETPPSL